MFTGIVEEIGNVVSIEKHIIKIEALKIFEDIKLGDSISVNGACLTVSAFSHNIFSADITDETLKRTNLGELKFGSKVNLERAMPLNGRFGGHIVSGHIDGIGFIKDMKKNNNSIILEISTSNDLMKYIVEKGSIAIDGISLTIAKLYSSSFSIAVIPHTLKETTLYYKKKGDNVNLETDIVGKYIERFLHFKDRSNIDMNFLLKNGF